jgi:hypothetical protein
MHQMYAFNSPRLQSLTLTPAESDDGDEEIAYEGLSSYICCKPTHRVSGNFL